MPLPEAYLEQIRAVPGVVSATHSSWFGGSYQGEENEFPVFPVVPGEYFEMYPELVVPPGQLEAWKADRTGAIVGRSTAERFGFEVGDRVPLQGTIYRRIDGSDTWEFTIDGIYQGVKKGMDETQFLFHYEFFNEARDLEQDLVGWYIARVEDPQQGAAVARAIDERFANSEYETETMSEKAFVQNFAKQIGDIGTILRWVLTAVFFTILLVAGNTMAQSVRERVSELAVLKTLGFTDRGVLALVLAESVVLALTAGAAGLLVGWLLVEIGGDPTKGKLAIFHFPGADVAAGAGFALLLGLVAGSLPAIRAMRLRIVDALRSA
jgi:putative ABC transport system permease protein